MGDVVNTASRLQTHGRARHGRRRRRHPRRHRRRSCATRRSAPSSPGAARRRSTPGWPRRRSSRPAAAPAASTCRWSGATRERDVIDSLIAAAVRRRRAATVVVVGEAGMGKTRLVEEAAARAEVRARRHRARRARACPTARPTCGGRSPTPSARASARPSAPRPTTRAGPASTASRLALPAAQEPRSTGSPRACSTSSARPDALEGIDPTRAREEVTRSLVSYVEGWAAQQPVVVVLSDLHWADDAVLALGDALAERAGGPALRAARDGPVGAARAVAAADRALQPRRAPPRPARPRRGRGAARRARRRGARRAARRSCSTAAAATRSSSRSWSSLLGEGGGRTGVPAHAARPGRRSPRRAVAARAADHRQRRHPRPHASAASPSHLMAEKMPGLSSREVDRGPRRPRRQGPARRRRRGIYDVPLRPRARGRLRARSPRRRASRATTAWRTGSRRTPR